ncbi:MAG: hypothetical protein HKP48_05875 [Winogradskyella sp.]|uniref:hypothetical protein n=1 Tax=Winogradskyella sp. TaxID=1883156 RepID=UPI0017E545B4|nr:hypothetical protein [Winogradskyella sp.]MBT8244579.1 hypothetical protein [Winogradskyella sp.]NNK22825.1 hypothetical protein [Winogradskyella sp.]
MKPLSFFIMLSFSLCASLCCPGEDEPGASFSIENNGLITIDNNVSTFNLNDQITIHTVIPDEQITTDGQSLNISELFYNDVLNESFLQHSLTLYKETDFGTLSKIAVTNQDIEASEGIVESFGDIIQIRNFYDTDTNTFRSKFSITLKETGTYYLSSNQFNFEDFRGISISGGIYELGFVTITTNILNTEENGGYIFVVN